MSYPEEASWRSFWTFLSHSLYSLRKLANDWKP